MYLLDIRTNKKIKKYPLRVILELIRLRFRLKLKLNPFLEEAKGEGEKGEGEI